MRSTAAARGAAASLSHDQALRPAAGANAAARFFRDNGLSLVLSALFAAFLIGQSLAGHREHNEELRAHGLQQKSYAEYLRTGHFLESVTENWESEFLQMGMFVILTTFLVQKGSAVSRRPGAVEATDVVPRPAPGDAPWPVRRGGLVLRVYEHSLSLALLFLFVLSFVLHAVGGAADYNQQQAAHGEAPVSTLSYMTTSRFWFESFQNWQSEFLAILAMVGLSVFLREKGSPESKPVFAPHDETGH